MASGGSLHPTVAFEVVRLTITDEEVQPLRKGVFGRGGMQDVLRRMQSRLRGNELEVYVSDLPKIAKAIAIGKGGFQRRFPIASLRSHLPSIAPLFADSREWPRRYNPGVWIYFITEIGGDPRIKIGQTTNPRRRGGGWRTDNPLPMELLLLLPPQEGVDDGTYHRRFAKHHSPRDPVEGQSTRRRKSGEWFWPGDDLRKFIREESAKQKLSKQRSGDDP